MPVRPLAVARDQGYNTVSYRATDGTTYNAKVEKVSAQSAAPAAPTMSTSTTGGTLAAATYSYRVSKIIDNVETLASTAGTQVTTGTTSTVTASWTNDPTAQGYRVYGRVGGSELLLAQLPAGSTSYVDTGAVTPAGALPTAMAANSLNLRIPGYRGLTTGILGGIAPATAMKQTNRYYHRPY